MHNMLWEYALFKGGFIKEEWLSKHLIRSSKWGGGVDNDMCSEDGRAFQAEGTTHTEAQSRGQQATASGSNPALTYFCK